MRERESGSHIYGAAQPNPESAMNGQMPSQDNGMTAQMAQQMGETSTLQMEIDIGMLRPPAVEI